MEPRKPAGGTATFSTTGLYAPISADSLKDYSVQRSSSRFNSERTPSLQYKSGVKDKKSTCNPSLICCNEEKAENSATRPATLSRSSLPKISSQFSVLMQIPRAINPKVNNGVTQKSSINVLEVASFFLKTFDPNTRILLVHSTFLLSDGT